MAGVTILQLPQALGLTGTEQIEAVQSGSSVRVPVSAIAALGPLGPVGPPGPPGTPGAPGPVSPFPTTTPAEIAADVTVVNTNYPECDIRRYGAVGAGEDDTAYINAVLAVSTKSGRSSYLAALALKSSGGHVHDISVFSVIGDGASIDFSAMASNGTAWSFTATIGGNGVNMIHQKYYLEGVHFFNGIAQGTCLFPNNSGEPAVTNFQVRNCSVKNFAVGVLFGSFEYNIDFVSVAVWNCTTGYYIPSTIAFAAELVAIIGGAIVQCGTGLDNRGGNSVVSLVGVRVDACTTYINNSNGGKTNLSVCHTEFNNASTLAAAPIQVAGGFVNFIGGDLMADGTGPFSYPAVFNIASGAQVSLTGQMFLNNLRNAANVLAVGSGEIYIDSSYFTYQSANLPTITSAQMNKMFDGGFEQSTIHDNISIVSDTATITSRTTGTNISISNSTAYPHTGSRSLAAVKAGASGTNAQYNIIFPNLRVGQCYGVTGWYAASGSISGSIFIYGIFTGQYMNGNGIPQYWTYNSQSGANIVNPTTTWTQFSIGQFIMPPYATNFEINVNLNSWNAGTFYLDDLIVTTY